MPDKNPDRAGQPWVGIPNTSHIKMKLMPRPERATHRGRLFESKRAKEKKKLKGEIWPNKYYNCVLYPAK